MKTAYEIPRVSEKLKRSSTPYSCKDETVFIYLDRMDGSVLVSRSQKFETVFEVEREDIKPLRKLNSSISCKPKVLTVDEKEHKVTLNDFYKDMALLLPFECQECNKPLYAYNTFAKRCCICHILPKSLFPTIATNPHNVLFMGADLLGYCADHDKWDSNLESRLSMKVYPLAIEAFATHLRHELNDTDLISACDYLGLSNWKEYVL